MEFGKSDFFKNLIGYEFEIERETRYIIAPGNIVDYNWVNRIQDVYDTSGRARVRLKNGKPRFSVKVPLFSQDTEKSKVCIRIELKPQNEEQTEELNRMRGEIFNEPGSQVSEKWGAPIVGKNGVKIWINRDINNNWWIEVDEGFELSLPESLKILSVQKSTVKV